MNPADIFMLLYLIYWSWQRVILCGLGKLCRCEYHCYLRVQYHPEVFHLIHSSMSSCHTVLKLLRVVFLNVPWSWWSNSSLIGTIKVIRQEPPQLLLPGSQLSYALIHFPPLSYYNRVGVSSNSAILTSYSFSRAHSFVKFLIPEAAIPPHRL